MEAQQTEVVIYDMQALDQEEDALNTCLKELGR